MLRIISRSSKRRHLVVWPSYVKAMSPCSSVIVWRKWGNLSPSVNCIYIINARRGFPYLACMRDRRDVYSETLNDCGDDPGQVSYLYSSCHHNKSIAAILNIGGRIVRCMRVSTLNPKPKP